MSYVKYVLPLTMGFQSVHMLWNPLLDTLKLYRSMLLSIIQLFGPVEVLAPYQTGYCNQIIACESKTEMYQCYGYWFILVGSQLQFLCARPDS